MTTFQETLDWEGNSAVNVKESAPDWINRRYPQVESAEISFDFTPKGPPVVYLAGSSSYIAGYRTGLENPITFLATVKFPPEVYAVEYYWDFGDGTEGWGNPVRHEFKYESERLRVTLRVTDNTGERHYVGKQLYISSTSSALEAMGPIALFVPNPDTHVVDELVGGYTATLRYGAEVVADKVFDAPGAILLDGVNDHVLTDAGTRRNLQEKGLVNDDTYWSAYRQGGSPDTYAQSDPSTDGPFGWSYGTVTADGVSAYYGIVCSYQRLSVDEGEDYTFSAYSRSPNHTGQWNLIVAWYTSVGDFIISSSGGQAYDLTSEWVRQEMTKTAPATAAYGAVYTQMTSTPPDGAILHSSCYMVEHGTTTGPYFDGHGYVDGNGDWQASEGKWCGWLGTAELSPSDYGIFANGTVRTFVAEVQRTDTVNNHTVWGDDTTSGYARAIFLAGGDTLQVTTDISTENESFANVDATAPTVLTTEIDEPDDLISQWVDEAEHTSSPSAHAAQYGEAPRNLIIGGQAPSGGNAPFKGYIGTLAIFDRSLTDEEQTGTGGLTSTALYPSDDLYPSSSTYPSD
jgi:hypothetical protein